MNKIAIPVQSTTSHDDLIPDCVTFTFINCSNTALFIVQLPPAPPLACIFPPITCCPATIVTGPAFPPLPQLMPICCKLVTFCGSEIVALYIGQYVSYRVTETNVIPTNVKARLSNAYFKPTMKLYHIIKFKNSVQVSERGNPTPTLYARLPQKTPSASPGQARCLSNTAITQGEPSPEARRAFPITQQKFSLDHDHATGEPRGLLHQACNMKVAQIETHTKKLNYIISRHTLAELALQFRKKYYQLLCAVLSYTEGSLALRCLSWP